MRYLIFILLFSSCYTAQKATDQVNKADSKFPEVVAKLARDKYPCTDLLKSDTAVIFVDSLIYIDCPDTAQIGTYETIRTDTVNHTVTKTIRVPVTLPIRTQVITKWFEDSAKLKLAAIQINNLAAENKAVKDQLNEINKKLATRTKYMIWLLLLCIGLAFFSLYKIIK